MTSILQDKTIAILGLGLIGGSVARGLKQNLPGIRLLAWDKAEAALEQGKQAGIVDDSGSLSELCQQADILVVALPSLTIAEVIPQVLKEVRPEAVVTDVGSVKSAIVAAAETGAPEQMSRFVPGHPIAGSEKSGFAAADADLFDGRNVILTPLPSNDCEAVAMVNELWRVLGSNVLGMELQWHDEVLAATSHLPHLLAYAIVDVLAGQESSEDIFRYAAGGFADFSRLASSDPDMWADIFIANEQAMVAVLDHYMSRLGDLRDLISAKDRAPLVNIFSNSNEVRTQFVKRYFSGTNTGGESESGDVIFEVQPGGKPC